MVVVVTNQDRTGMWRRMRVVRDGWGRRASEMGRRRALRTVGMAVMYSDEEDGGVRDVVVRRFGVERERREEEEDC